MNRFPPWRLSLPLIFYLSSVQRTSMVNPCHHRWRVYQHPSIVDWLSINCASWWHGLQGFIAIDDLTTLDGLDSPLLSPFCHHWLVISDEIFTHDPHASLFGLIYFELVDEGLSLKPPSGFLLEEMGHFSGLMLQFCEFEEKGSSNGFLIVDSENRLMVDCAVGLEPLEE